MFFSFIAANKYKLFLLFLIALAITESTYAQIATKEKENEEHFIHEGKFLTSFSVSFINASRNDYGRFLARELTQIVFQIDGIYFLTDRIGIGPLVSYQFNYWDFEDPYQQEDIDLRTSELKLGALAGYYLLTGEIFGGKSDSYLFINGGINFHRNIFNKEGRENIEADFLFGYQVNTGILLPVGKQIAITAKLGFQSQKQQYALPIINENSELVYVSRKRWTRALFLSIGLSVTF